MKPCYIFDLDGTIADNTHRLHFIQKEPKDWAKFFDACTDDIPNKHVVRLYTIVLYSLTEDEEVFICTGRPQSHEAQTVWWFGKHSIPMSPFLMRPTGDHRPDTIVKKEMLDFIRGFGREPIFAVDDRPEVIAMWRANNVPCFAVESNWVK